MNDARRLAGLIALIALLSTGCGDDGADDSASDVGTGDGAADVTDTTATAETTDSGEDRGADPASDAAGTVHTPDGCGHDVDPAAVSYGLNVVLSEAGAVKKAQGQPFQEGDTLGTSESEVADANDREYARVATLMMPIRDALMCDISDTSLDEWHTLTEVLTLNGIKTTQDLSGTRKEQFYSTDGIYEHLREGEDFHPMMKYLEEAELELKCLAFVDFDFTNPEGDNHCEIHGLAEGSGIILP